MKFALLCCVVALASAAPQTVLLGPHVPQVLTYAAPASQPQRSTENLLRVYKDAVKLQIQRVATNIGILDEVVDIVYGAEHEEELSLDDVIQRLEQLQQENPQKFGEVFTSVQSAIAKGKPTQRLLLFPITVPAPDGTIVTISKPKFEELKNLLAELVIKGELEMQVVLQLVNPFGWKDLDLEELLDNIETITADNLDLLKQILVVLFPFFDEEEALRSLSLQRSALIPAPAAPVLPSIYNGLNYRYSYAGFPYTGLPYTGLQYAGYPYANSFPYAPYYTLPTIKH